MNQGYCALSSATNSNVGVTTESERVAQRNVLLDSEAHHKDGELKPDSGNGRVMLIDGTSIIYRAYYRLLGMLNCLVWNFHGIT